ncbi:MAG: hypothetical protein QF464_16915, partial [Myxococcota bacterium]|nr:hypothetical protein [Myxococcota bacterium]
MVLMGLCAVGCESEPAPDLLTVKLFASPLADDPFTDVAFLVFRVKADDLSEDLVSVTEFAAGAGGEAPLPTIPYSANGIARQVVVEGWASTTEGALSHVVSVGRSQEFDVQATDEPRTVYIQMARINSFSPLTEVFTHTSQIIQTGRVGHTVTHTARGETVIAGGGIPNSDGSPWWTRDGLGGFLSAVEIVDGVTQAAELHYVELYTVGEDTKVCTLETCPNGGTPQSGLSFPRAWHTATGLPTGQVFFAGGWSLSGDSHVTLPYVEWYEPEGQIAVLLA